MPGADVHGLNSCLCAQQVTFITALNPRKPAYSDVIIISYHFTAEQPGAYRGLIRCLRPQKPDLHTGDLRLPALYPSLLNCPVKPYTHLLFLKNKFIYLFIYFWLRRVFVAVCGLSLVAASGGSTLCCSVWASHCGGFSCCRAQALGTRASVVVARGL